MLTRFAAPPNDRGQGTTRTGASVTGPPNSMEPWAKACIFDRPACVLARLA